MRYNRVPMKWFAAVTFVAIGLAAAAQPARRAVTLVVVGGTVITQNAARDIISPGAVAIDGTDIIEVGPPEAIAAKYRASETIEARDEIVLPGSSTRTRMRRWCCTAGLADDLALMDWLQKHIFPAEAKTVSPEMVRGARAGGARDDPVRHNDLRRHVLLRGGDRRDHKGPACAPCSARRSSSSRSPTQKHRRRVWHARSGSSGRSRTTASPCPAVAPHASIRTIAPRCRHPPSSAGATASRCLSTSPKPRTNSPSQSNSSKQRPRPT